MDPAFMVSALVASKKDLCPYCKGRIAKVEQFEARILEIPILNDENPMLQLDGFEVTLVCAVCHRKSRVNETHLGSCVNQ